MNSKLINAVKKQLGDDSYLEDVVNHGAAAGFPGFTYYNDTVKFFKKNKQLILDCLVEFADDYGEAAVAIVRDFQCLNNQFSIDEVARALYGTDNGELDLIYNALAWFALEEVARFETDN